MTDIRDLWRGLRVVYRFRPSGGYGFVLAVPATVEFVHRKRVQILIEGIGTRLTVSPESLTIPEAPRGMRDVVATVEVPHD